MFCYAGALYVLGKCSETVKPKISSFSKNVV